MKYFIKKIRNQLLNRSSDGYKKLLNKHTSECKNVLDVGCGNNSPVQFLKDKSIYKIGVDAFEPSIKDSQIKKFHNEYHKLNIMELEKKFLENSVDCVLANDIIEHLNKDDGEKLIKMIEKIARKKVIIFTPNGFLEQSPYNNNIWQRHLSGWTYKEMIKKNYKIFGIGGLKYIKSERARIKYKPYKLWKVFSEISQIFTKKILLKHSFAIFCIKTIED